jgi:hypothetical protein
MNISQRNDFVQVVPSDNLFHVAKLLSKNHRVAVVDSSNKFLGSFTFSSFSRSRSRSRFRRCDAVALPPIHRQAHIIY